MQINLDPFFERSAQLAKQKRLLEYVFREPCRNEKAISILDVYLPQKQAEARADWTSASKQYEDGYISTKYRCDLTAGEIQAAETANRKMLNKVKRCKSKYEHWGKLIAHYEKHKKQLKIKIEKGD